MAKKYRKPLARPNGYAPSCIDSSRWTRTVSRVIDTRSPERRASSPKPAGWEEKSATGIDNKCNPTREIYPRRQENLITKFERDIPAQKIGHLKSNKTIATQIITEDFVGNSMDAFERKFDQSNRLICSDLVVALSPKKANKVSPRTIALHEKDYADSLEWYNLCRNCKQPIKTRRATFDDCIVFSETDVTLTEKKVALLDRLSSYASDLKGDIDSSHRILLYAAVNKAKMELAALYKDGIHTVGEIPAHYEVYFCDEKQGYKYRQVERKLVFNQKCECMFVEQRRVERGRARVDAKAKSL